MTAMGTTEAARQPPRRPRKAADQQGEHRQHEAGKEQAVAGRHGLAHPLVVVGAAHGGFLP